MSDTQVTEEVASPAGSSNISNIRRKPIDIIDPTMRPIIIETAEVTPEMKSEQVENATTEETLAGKNFTLGISHDMIVFILC